MNYIISYFSSGKKIERCVKLQLKKSVVLLKSFQKVDEKLGTECLSSRLSLSLLYDNKFCNKLFNCSDNN